jgi:uncharacterized protein (DUF433 family)
MLRDRITSEPSIMFGKPVVAGTRITIEHIVRKLAAGRSVDELLEAHPHLTREDVQAALTYAADSVSGETVLAA